VVKFVLANISIFFVISNNTPEYVLAIINSGLLISFFLFIMQIATFHLLFYTFILLYSK